MNMDFMRRALELAGKGIGFTSPNPAVGAVIVKGGKIVAEGWHHKAGEDHAEIVAMKSLMRKSGMRGAALYVTLEPCAHNGKTPPCAKAIVAAGFKKVYVGMKDPSPKVNGKGLRYLKNYHVEVEVLRADTALAGEIRLLNQPFIKWSTIGLPYVIMKAGISLDGKIATAAGNSKWITSLLARRDARLMRSQCDAVIVGAGTVEADDPELAAHGRYARKGLLRVIIDKKLGLSLSRRVFRDQNVFVACTDLAPQQNGERYRLAGVSFKSFGKQEISFKKLLKCLADRNITSVFVEGGSSVHGAFFDQALREKNLIDYVLFYIAPTLIGGRKAKSVIAGEGAKTLTQAVNLKDLDFQKVGNDFKVSGKVISY